MGGDSEPVEWQPATVTLQASAVPEAPADRDLIALMAASIYPSYSVELGERRAYGAVLAARELLAEIDRQLAPIVDPNKS
jgi:hypothetical protein